MESLLSLEELINAVKGSQYDSNISLQFDDVQTDSRNVKENTLFVPLIGEFQNGHKYIPQALKNGASVVLLNKDEYKNDEESYKKLIQENKNVVFIGVDNTLSALQDAAECYVSKFPSLIKISVTGSCGKTTTKEMLVSVFKAKYGDRVVYTQGNFNSETGLPLSVFNIRKNHEIGIFEMGMNRENEIGEISKVLKSKYGIITNIGTAHIGILGSRENIAKEKRKSFDYVPADGAVFVPFDDDFADFCCENVKGKVVKFGKEMDDKNVSFNGFYGTEFLLDGIKITLPLSGKYNLKNALGVIACAKELGFTSLEIKQGLENMPHLSGRMETKEIELKNGSKINLIKDCYNANLDSMSSVIEFCGNLDNVGKKIFVLADMKELGKESEKSHRKIGELINKVHPEYVFLVGTEIEKAYEECCSKNGQKKNIFWYEEKSESVYNKIAEEINKVADKNDVILLKGSHSMELEKLEPLIRKETENVERKGE